MKGEEKESGGGGCMNSDALDSNAMEALHNGDHTSFLHERGDCEVDALFVDELQIAASLGRVSRLIE